MAENELYETVVRTLIGVLKDGVRGFQDFGEKLEAPMYRSFYLEESRVRAAFAAELERELEATCGSRGQETGTLFGTAHRLYADLKTALVKGDYSLLDTTERCERLAVKLYDDAVRMVSMPEQLVGMLAYQAGHVRRVHGIVKEFRAEAREEAL